LLCIALILLFPFFDGLFFRFDLFILCSGRVPRSLTSLHPRLKLLSLKWTIFYMHFLVIRPYAIIFAFGYNYLMDNFLSKIMKCTFWFACFSNGHTKIVCLLMICEIHLQAGSDPVMTAYKLVTIDAPYWGFGRRLELALIEVPPLWLQRFLMYYFDYKLSGKINGQSFLGQSCLMKYIFH